MAKKVIDPPHPQDWTPDFAYEHLKNTFTQQFHEHPDLLEPYVLRLDTASKTEKIEIMRDGLRKTIKQRYPL